MNLYTIRKGRTVRDDMIDGPSTEDLPILLAERQEEVINLLRRRPCTIQDVADVLGLNINEVSKYLGILSEEGFIEPVSTMTGLTYFRGRPGI